MLVTHALPVKPATKLASKNTPGSRVLSFEVGKHQPWIPDALNQELTPAWVQWLECLPHGNGIMRVSRSCTCLGSFVQGVLCGPAIMVFSDGDLYVGHAKGGLRHGNGLLELADGTLYAGHFSQVTAISRV